MAAEAFADSVRSGEHRVDWWGEPNMRCDNAEKRQLTGCDTVVRTLGMNSSESTQMLK